MDYESVGRGAKPVSYHSGTGGFGQFHPFMGLIARRPGRGEIKKARRDRQVNVFGKAFDDLKDFRKRGSPFEDQAFGKWRVEEKLQEPTDPEVFFEDERRDVFLQGSLFEVQAAFIGG